MQWISRRYYCLAIYLLGLDTFRWRYLSLGEIQLAKTIFGDLIDYSLVKVYNQRFIPWQLKGMVMAPCGAIHMCPTDFIEDFSTESRMLQALFIHEMTHIYQYQLKIAVLYKGALLQSAYYLSFKRYNPYYYRIDPNKSFMHYNIEQQGEIAKDIFLKKLPNIIKKPSPF